MIPSYSIDAAPLGSERNLAANSSSSQHFSHSIGRRRKRGPRSALATLRRSLPKHCGTPADMVSGKSETAISDTASTSQSLSIYSINIRCLLAHVAELSFHLSVHKPHIVLIQESWLNKSIEHVSIANYSLLSRRDRSDTENRGGIIAFVRSDVRQVVHYSDSEHAERNWHLLHLDIGGFVLCN